MDIFLHDACAPCRASILGDYALKLAPFLGHLDTDTTIGALARLRDPDIVRVTVLLVVLPESKEVGVIESFLDMKRNWQRVERILTDGLIIILHIYKEGFLIAKMIIIFDLVGQLDWVCIKGLNAPLPISGRCSLLLLALFLVQRRR